MTKARGKPRLIDLGHEDFKNRVCRHGPWDRLEFADLPLFLRGLPKEKVMGSFVSGSTSPRQEAVPGLGGQRPILYSWDVIRYDQDDFPKVLNNESYKIVEAVGGKQFLLVGPVLPRNHHADELDAQFLDEVVEVVYPDPERES